MVGQEHAKKVLSVAVYNHYKRIFHNVPLSSNGNSRKNQETPAAASSLGQQTYNGRGRLNKTFNTVLFFNLSDSSRFSYYSSKYFSMCFLLSSVHGLVLR